MHPEPTFFLSIILSISPNGMRQWIAGRPVIEVGSDIVRRRALLMHVLMIPAIVIPTVVTVTMIVGIAAEPTAAHRLR